MARRLPRLLIPVAIALVAMVLAFWAVAPSQAQENPPTDRPSSTTPAEHDEPYDLPTMTKLPKPPKDGPQGPKDCASCAHDDPL